MLVINIDACASHNSFFRLQEPKADADGALIERVHGAINAIGSAGLHRPQPPPRPLHVH